LLSSINKEYFSFEFSKKKKRIIIIGDKHENNRVYSIIKQTQVVPELVGYVNTDEKKVDPGFLGHIGQIEEVVRINHVDELIFCAATMTSQQIIRTMLQFTDTGIEFKIAPPESLSVIGSNSIDTSGELYVLHFNTLSRLLNKRKKRLFDIVLSLVMLPCIPVLLFMVESPGGLIRNIFGALFGMISWVGYFHSTGGHHPGLPKIKPGVLTPIDGHKHADLNENYIEQVNLSYAKDYHIANDLKIIMNDHRLLGRRPVATSIADDINKPGYGKS
jgi:hypothetical protein